MCLRFQGVENQCDALIKQHCDLIRRASHPQAVHLVLAALAAAVVVVNVDGLAEIGRLASRLVYTEVNSIQSPAQIVMPLLA